MVSVVWMARDGPLGRGRRGRQERYGRTAGRSVFIRHEASWVGLGLGSEVRDFWIRQKAISHQHY